MVNHGLDEEEMAFKKSMEAQAGDDIDELFNFTGQDDLEFDTNDLDNIEMLQVKPIPVLKRKTPYADFLSGDVLFGDESTWDRTC